MYEGSLVGTRGHPELYQIRSLVNFEKSGKFNIARNGNQGGPWEFYLLKDGFPTF